MMKKINFSEAALSQLISCLKNIVKLKLSGTIFNKENLQKKHEGVLAYFWPRTFSEAGSLISVHILKKNS